MNIVVENILPSTIIQDEFKSSGLALVLISRTLPITMVIILFWYMICINLQSIMDIMVENVLPSGIIPDDLKSSGLALGLVFIPDIPHTTNHNGYI